MSWENNLFEGEQDRGFEQAMAHYKKALASGLSEEAACAVVKAGSYNRIATVCEVFLSTKERKLGREIDALSMRFRDYGDSEESFQTEVFEEFGRLKNEIKDLRFSLYDVELIANEALGKLDKEKLKEVVETIRKRHEKRDFGYPDEDEEEETCSE